MNEDIKKFPLWRQAVEDFVALDPKPGHTINQDWLLEHLELAAPRTGTYEDIKRFELQFLRARTDFFQALRDKHQLQFAERRAGVWRLLHPSEVARVAMTELAEATRAAALKATKRVSNVDVLQLTDRQQAELSDSAARLSRIRQMARTETRLPSPQPPKKD